LEFITHFGTKVVSAKTERLAGKDGMSEEEIFMGGDCGVNKWCF
jgi:hypothetical protein